MKKIAFCLTMVLGTCSVSDVYARTMLFHIADVTLLNYDNPFLGKLGAENKIAKKVVDYGQFYYLPGTNEALIRRYPMDGYDSKQAKANVLKILGQKNSDGQYKTSIYVDLKVGQFRNNRQPMKASDRLVDCDALDIQNDAIFTPFFEGNEKKHPIRGNREGIRKNLTFNIYEREASQEAIFSKIPEWEGKSWKQLTLRELVNNFVLIIGFSDHDNFKWLHRTFDRLDPTDLYQAIGFRPRTEEERARAEQSEGDDDDLSDQGSEHSESLSDQGDKDNDGSLGLGDDNDPSSSDQASKKAGNVVFIGVAIIIGGIAFIGMMFRLYRNSVDTSVEQDLTHQRKKRRSVRRRKRRRPRHHVLGSVS